MSVDNTLKDSIVGQFTWFSGLSEGSVKSLKYELLELSPEISFSSFQYEGIRMLSGRIDKGFVFAELFRILILINVEHDVQLSECGNR